MSATYGVNIAARLEPLAEPGGICISQAVYDMVRSRSDIQTVSLGPRELKNISEAVNLYRVLVDAQQPRTTPESPPPVPKRRGLFVFGVLVAGQLGMGLWMVQPMDLEEEAPNNPQVEPHISTGKAKQTSFQDLEAPLFLGITPFEGVGSDPGMAVALSMHARGFLGGLPDGASGFRVWWR